MLLLEKKLRLKNTLIGNNKEYAVEFLCVFFILWDYVNKATNICRNCHKTTKFLEVNIMFNCYERVMLEIKSFYKYNGIIRK